MVPLWLSQDGPRRNLALRLPQDWNLNIADSQDILDLLGRPWPRRAGNMKRTVLARKELGKAPNGTDQLHDQCTPRLPLEHDDNDALCSNLGAAALIRSAIKTVPSSWMSRQFARVLWIPRITCHQSQ